MRDEDICQQNGVELLPEAEERSSIASRFESNNDDVEVNRQSSDLMGQDSARLHDYGLTKQKLAFFDSC